MLAVAESWENGKPVPETRTAQSCVSACALR